MPAHRISRPLVARFYARISPAMDTGGMAARRQQLLEGLTGTVIEIGAGNGLNFAYYPAGVTRVLAVEPDPFPGRARLGSTTADGLPREVSSGVMPRRRRQSSHEASAGKPPAHRTSEP